MNKKGLAQKLQENFKDLNKKESLEIIDYLFNTIIEELKNDQEVSITGFGTFLTRTRHARGGVNPRKPEERITIPEVRVAKFRTGKNLKDALK
ncbi:HU family DNA-binding protein [bacterium]|nr:HU family DNA-binding protein [bacterium]